MAVSSIAATLGSGSGIDTVSLVSKLVEAQFAAKTGQLKSREETLTAQIGGAASLKSTISTFSSALNSLVRGGTLTTTPTSSNTGAARITPLPGKTVTNLSATLEVVRLAKPQSAASAVIADRTAAIGGGSFTLTFGAATVADGRMTDFEPGPGTPQTITIPDDASLDAIAGAINAQAQGVTATVIGDGDGTRLMLKGATGASQAFTLTSEDAGLAALSVGVDSGDSRIGSIAQDAEMKLDGVTLTRASNTVSNLIDGVKVELVGAGITALGTAAPTAAMAQAANDFVASYNEVFAVLKAQTDAKTGVLRADPAAQALQRALARLPTTLLASGDGPRSLAEIGVATNRDGTLRIEAATLTSALTNNATAIERMFSAETSGGGIAGALASISTAAVSVQTGLGASEARFTSARSALADQQTKASGEAEKLRTRLTQQFAVMDARVAAYKSTQTFLENQVKAWNRDS